VVEPIVQFLDLVGFCNKAPPKHELGEAFQIEMVLACELPGSKGPLD